MKFLALSAAAFAAVAPALAQTAQAQVDTVTGVTQCQPILFTWHGGTGPYFLSLIPAAQPSAPAIKTFPQQTGTSFTWLVDLPAQSTFTIALKDQTGATSFSDIVTINNSTDTSCLNTAVQDDGKGNASGATAANTPANTSPGASSTSGGAAQAPTGGASTSSGGSSSSAAPTTSPTTSAGGSGGSQQNSATKNVLGSFGIAAIMGAVGVALF
ncbi:hypothetical protein EIP91_010029 [Steccherinum ochraceum]|uniref:Uncharacterized protein n=1 Tax=Steccherinum ochraceum TaxID=92696 RepID=A0A4R0R106_9APHY|nr:hypothetical protein EIP91_010029 [Steccherinum ochraceum]